MQARWKCIVSDALVFNRYYSFNYQDCFVRTDEKSNPQGALSRGTYGSSLIVIIAAFILSRYMFGNLNAFWAVASGLIAGSIIGFLTEMYTSSDYKYVKKIAQQSGTGPATTIISGLAVECFLLLHR